MKKPEPATLGELALRNEIKALERRLNVWRAVTALAILVALLATFAR